MADTILWIYIVLLVAGGIAGFLKAGSKVSLATSLIFAVLLGLFAAGILPWAVGANVVLGVLLIVFVIRFAKTKKFMPAGLLCLLTVAVLLARLFI